MPDQITLAPAPPQPETPDKVVSIRLSTADFNAITKLAKRLNYNGVSALVRALVRNTLDAANNGTGKA